MKKNLIALALIIAFSAMALPAFAQECQTTKEEGAGFVRVRNVCRRLTQPLNNQIVVKSTTGNASAKIVNIVNFTYSNGGNVSNTNSATIINNVVVIANSSN